MMDKNDEKGIQEAYERKSIHHVVCVLHLPELKGNYESSFWVRAKACMQFGQLDGTPSLLRL